MLALFQATYVGAPMIYYGTEFGLWVLMIQTTESQPHGMRLTMKSYIGTEMS